MFDNHFEVFLADTEESKEIHYNIRYQVYCEEMGFENKEDFPDEMEYDADDDKSVHFILRNKKTKQWIGAMRLIEKRNGLLPVEQLCEVGDDMNSKTVEISRLCILKEARVGAPPIGSTDNKKNRMIIWGLFYAAVKYGYNNKISHSYFMTTSALARILKRAGLNLIKVGDSCQHKGERFPFKMNTKDVYNSDVWKFSCSHGFSLYSAIKGFAVAA